MFPAHKPAGLHMETFLDIPDFAKNKHGLITGQYLVRQNIHIHSFAGLNSHDIDIVLPADINLCNRFSDPGFRNGKFCRFI